MSKILIIFKNKSSCIWFCVTAVLLALIIVANILASTMLYSLLSVLFGGERAVFGGGSAQQMYKKDYETKDEAKKAGDALNEKIAAEGFVLLKNEKVDETTPALPLAAGAKISVFGKNSVKLSYGGSGSGGKTLSDAKTIFDSLVAAGFTYNDTLKAFYESSASGSGRSPNPGLESGGASYLNTGETPQSSYTKTVKDSYASYKDAALVVFTRIGGEDWDLPRAGGHHSSNANNPDDHYLQLDKNEKDLLKAICDEGFQRIIVILNTNNPMELGFLDDEAHYAHDERINGCLWIGTPGETGIMALGKILSGEVSPSGKTVDTWARNFKEGPTYVNFGNYGESYGQNYTSAGGEVNYYYTYVDYEEGIYVGYRYYETRGYSDGETWYKDNVVYPFGHGLSYTAFTQEIVNKTDLNNKAIPASGKISVQVKVTNTGNVAGKDVIQIYVTAPYTGAIEKAHVVLAGFAKTPLLQPGSANAAIVTVEIDPYLVASYNMNADNGGNKGCYLLEAGEYVFKLSKNAHAVGGNLLDSFTAVVSGSGIRFENGAGGSRVVNRYEDAAEGLGSILSRNGWKSTWPEKRTAEQRVLGSALQAALDSKDSKNPNVYGWEDYPELSSGSGAKFQDVLDPSAPKSKGYGDSAWDDLLNALSISEMTALVTDGQFKTAKISSANVPATTNADGPFGFVNFMSVGEPTVYGCCYYSSEVVLASTWNVELAEAMGMSIGNESLIGNEKGDGIPYSGWYAPGVNIHRSPFGGRLGEYFSEDPLLSGKIAAAEVKGARSKGVMTFVKHFAVNEQETSRLGIATWLTEQSLREIYLRPFELAVTEGKTVSIMSSFNRIGAVWTGGDYRLLTEILRGEWGFRGVVVCDYNANNSFMDAKQMIYAGGDLHLFTVTSKVFSPSAGSPSDIVNLRIATKNILYAVANSNIRDFDIIGYRLPLWQVIMFIVDGVIVTGLAVWGFFALRRIYKKPKKGSQ